MYSADTDFSIHLFFFIAVNWFARHVNLLHLLYILFNKLYSELCGIGLFLPFIVSSLYQAPQLEVITSTSCALLRGPCSILSALTSFLLQQDTSVLLFFLSYSWWLIDLFTIHSKASLILIIIRIHLSLNMRGTSEKVYCGFCF